MKGKHILRYTREELDKMPDETDWNRVEKMTDEQVFSAALEDPDAQPTDYDFWKDAQIISPSHAVLRVELDILKWFKAQGEDYQKRMNAVLRDYVYAHQ